MKVTKYSEPWDWFEVHSFFSTEEDFNKIDEFSKNISIYDKRSSKVLYREDNEEVYHMLYDRMKVLCNKIGFTITDNMDLYVQFDNIKPGWAYSKVHSDHNKKFVTFVMAVSEEGTGTHLYSKDRTTYIKTTDWIQNGGNGFIRQDHSWHDFDAKGLTNDRRTVICMIAEKGWDDEYRYGTK